MCGATSRSRLPNGLPWPVERGLDPTPIRTAVRTGDTPSWERQQMGRKPPHVLVTTPESLFILLTAERPRRMLRTVIADEIHAIAGDKRGSHQALSPARLDARTGAFHVSLPALQ